MSVEKFTQGKWFANGAFVEIDETGNEIVSGVGHGSNEELQANAHLISAAPDMYRMLRKMQKVKNLERDIDWDKVESILAKADGE